MALNVTLLDLRTQVRDRADMKHSTFCVDSEINTWINSAYAELYDLLVKATEDYFVTSASIVTDGLEDTYALPTDFYKLNGVDYDSNGITSPMDRFTFQDRNKYKYNQTIVRYRIVGNNILFAPIPAAQTMTLWYTPAITPMVADTDEIDSVNGWDDFIVVSAAIKCLLKEESDPSMLMAEMRKLESDITEMANNRDQSKPDRVTDVTGSRINSYFIGDETWL